MLARLPPLPRAVCLPPRTVPSLTHDSSCPTAITSALANPRWPQSTAAASRKPTCSSRMGWESPDMVQPRPETNESHVKGVPQAFNWRRNSDEPWRPASWQVMWHSGAGRPQEGRPARQTAATRLRIAASTGSSTVRSAPMLRIDAGRGAGCDAGCCACPPPRASAPCPSPGPAGTRSAVTSRLAEAAVAVALAIPDLEAGRCLARDQGCTAATATRPLHPTLLVASGAASGSPARAARYLHALGTSQC